MTFSAVEIAAYFVKRAIEEGSAITQMKVQKVVYFAHGYHLAKTGNPLIREKFQAWKFGPVVPAIYDAFKTYGSQPIATGDYLLPNTISVKAALSVNRDLKESLDGTWVITKELDALKLSAWSHEKNGPWAKYYVEGVNDIDIDNNTIKEYFSEVLKKVISKNENSN